LTRWRPVRGACWNAQPARDPDKTCYSPVTELIPMPPYGLFENAEMSLMLNPMKLSTGPPAVYQDRKCRPSHISARMDAFTRPRCTCSHSWYSLHTDRHRAWPGLAASGWSGHRFCTRRRSAWIPAPRNRLPSRRRWVTVKSVRRGRDRPIRDPALPHLRQRRPAPSAQESAARTGSSCE